MTPHEPTQNPRTADTGVPTYAAENRSPGEIDRDLRATRARIDRHLDELSRRSNPLNIARSLLGGSSASSSRIGSSLSSMMGSSGDDSGNGSGNDSTGDDDGASFAEVRDAVVEKARRNPIGLAMIAGGLAWSLLVEDDRAVLGRAAPATTTPATGSAKRSPPTRRSRSSSGPVSGRRGRSEPTG